MILGGALTVSGFLLQTFFHNPIASPFVLGISSGAKLTVALVMIFLLQRGVTVSSGAMVISAFAGSLISMGFVLLISKRVTSMSILVVSGVMIGYICSAITDFVVTFADDSNIVNLHNWSMGSFSGTSWGNVQVMAVIVIITSLLVFFMSKPIGVYQLGEVYAQNMGVNIKLFGAFGASFQCIVGLCHCVCGACFFCGYCRAPYCQKCDGNIKTASGNAGLLSGRQRILSVCDLIARTLFAPTELSISSVTAVFGAPIVIWIMVRRRMAK